jgi:serine/threonine-protein kinase
VIDEHPHRCPTCQRSFDEPGFCPYDGQPLVDTRVADKPTLKSDAIPTQRGVAEPPSQPIRAVSAAENSDSVDSILETMRREPQAPTEYDALVGQTLAGRYFVEKKIGEGGMGVVFAARHAVIERPLAIKVLKREVMRDLVTIQRFRQEAKAASRIGHPNIVDVIDFDTTDTGMTFSVMELVAGTTLGKEIKANAPFPFERALRIAAQLARALGAAHDKGIVHRDLKPGNVFLVDRDDRPDFVKIVDFGIARVTSLEGANEPRLTRQGSVFGTPEYMAPEQASGRGDIDRRADIYALGVIMYEMLVGKVPIKGRNMVQTIAMQMMEAIVPPSQKRPELGIPLFIEAVVMKALAKNRDERYATMAEMLAAIDECSRRLHADPTLPSLEASLQPLPPGADPNVETAQPAAELRSQDRPRRSKPDTRPLHEPEFVGQPLTFGGVFEADAPPPSSEEPSHRKWILAALVGVVVVFGGGVLIYLATRGGGDEPSRVATAEKQDAAMPVVPPTPPPTAPRDAGRIVADVPADAARDVPRPAPRDAGVHVVRPGRDAGVRHPHVGPGDTVRVTVYVKPGDAKLFHGDEYIGEPGVTVERPYGTTLVLECRAIGYQGTVRVAFDGSHDNVMCNAVRIKRCVPGLHNPIDKCDENETTPGGDGPALHPKP